ncbi:MAG: flagellar basal body P-ring formation chaperone FlgA [Synergistaceae bacterium]|nr:flagellar basal body P-ring formation chaperone FlgA [Synergistaceae bacterium]
MIALRSNRTGNSKKNAAALVFALALFTMFMAVLPASAEDLKIEFPATIEAREGSFYLGEYAALYGPDDFIDSASMALISPLNGSFSRDDVVAALGGTKFVGASVAVRMPDVVIVSPESAVASELRAMTAWEWRIAVEGLESENPAKGEFSLPPRVLPGARSLTVKLFDEDGRKSNKQIKVRWYQPVVYATKAIAREARIDPSILAVRIGMAGMTTPLISDSGPLSRLTLRKAVMPGNFIATSDVDSKAVIRSGCSVKLIASVNGLGVEVQGIALQRGALGDIIRVRNLSTRKVLSGTVVDVGLVAINGNN